MWSQTTNDRFLFAIWPAFGLPMGVAVTVEFLSLLGKTAWGWLDGYSTVDAFGVLGSMLFIAAGCLLIVVALAMLICPFEVRLLDDGPLECASWLKRTRISPDRIQTISTLTMSSEEGGARFVRVVSSSGCTIDVPESERSEELISLLTSRNPSITVQREW